MINKYVAAVMERPAKDIMSDLREALSIADYSKDIAEINKCASMINNLKDIVAYFAQIEAET